MALEWDDSFNFEFSEIEKTDHPLRHQQSVKSMKLFFDLKFVHSMPLKSIWFEMNVLLSCHLVMTFFYIMETKGFNFNHDLMLLKGSKQVNFKNEKIKEMVLASCCISLKVLKQKRFPSENENMELQFVHDYLGCILLTIFINVC